MPVRSVRKGGPVARAVALLLTAALAACTDAPPAAPDAAPPDAAGPGLRTGYVVGRSGRPEQVRYEVREGYAIVEGDIVLGPAAEVAGSLEELRRRPAARPRFGVVTADPSLRWTDGRAPDYGVVYYEIDPALPRPELVREAIERIETASAGVYFYPRTTEADYLRFVPTPGTNSSSYVGRWRGAQPVWLANANWQAGTVQHEILHALGLWHEQSRCDRDAYIEVLWGEIDPAYHAQYAKYCDGVIDVGEYDEGSIMHYPTWAYSVSGRPTMRSRRGRDAVMGQRFDLGPSDIATLRTLYAPNGPVPRCRPAYPGGPCAGAQAALVSRASGKCVDVPAGSRVPGTRLAIWPCHGGENQRFTLPAAGATSEIRVYAGAETLCLDAASGDGKNGDPIVVWPCHGGANQRWTRTAAGLLVGVNGRCIDVEGGRTADLTPLLLWDCHGAANQQWDPRTATVAVR